MSEIPEPPTTNETGFRTQFQKKIEGDCIVVMIGDRAVIATIHPPSSDGKVVEPGDLLYNGFADRDEALHWFMQTLGLCAASCLTPEMKAVATSLAREKLAEMLAAAKKGTPAP